MGTGHPRPDPGEWVTLEQAARMTGHSRDGFRELAARKGLVTFRRGPRPGVRRADVETLVAEALIEPGQLSTDAPSWFRRSGNPSRTARRPVGQDPAT